MKPFFRKAMLHWGTVAVLSTGATAFAATEVHVTNFPSTQTVKGAVSIEGVSSHGKSVKREGVLVQTGKRNESNDLTYVGVVDTEGFTYVTLSLQGEVKSTNFLPGAVGVMLVPDEEPILRVLRDYRLVQFPIECAAPMKNGDPEYFSAPKCQESISFPRYRIYLYNTLNRTVEANVYLYLSN